MNGPRDSEARGMKARVHHETNNPAFDEILCQWTLERKRRWTVDCSAHPRRTGSVPVRCSGASVDSDSDAAASAEAESRSLWCWLSVALSACNLGLGRFGHMAVYLARGL